MSNRKIVPIVVVIAIFLVAFVFLVNRASIWQISNSKVEIGQQAEADSQKNKVMVIDQSNLDDLAAQIQANENSESELINILDRFVLTGKNLNKTFENYQVRGINLENLNKELQNYYGLVEESVNFFNSAEYGEMSENMQSALLSLSDIFSDLKEIVLVNSDKPFQCALPNTKAVYNCENNYKKAVLFGGDVFYNSKGEKVEYEVKCFEDFNLCD